MIADDCVIGAGATVSHSLIGNRVNVYPGARLGQDSFRFAMPAGHLKIPQVGRVIVEDDVEIGANTTIDRGAGRGTEPECPGGSGHPHRPPATAAARLSAASAAGVRPRSAPF